MSVLQDIYDSEINVSISTMWDGGYDLAIGCPISGPKATGNVDRWGDVEPWFRAKALEHYPDSLFALMYRDGKSRYQADRLLRDRAAREARARK